MAGYKVTPNDEQIYTKEYCVDGPDLHGHKLSIYAECRKSPFFKTSGQFYYVDLHFALDKFGMKEHLIGFEFGYQGMSRDEIDREILAYVHSQLDEDFMVLVRGYFLKERLYTEWLESHHEELKPSTD